MAKSRTGKKVSKATETDLAILKEEGSMELGRNSREE